MAPRAPSMMRVHCAICVTVNLPRFPPELVAAIVVLIAEEHAYTPDNWPAFVAFVDEVIECFGIHDPTKSVDEKEYLSVDTNEVYRKAFVAISSYQPPRARFSRCARWTIEPAVPDAEVEAPPAEDGAGGEAVAEQVGDEHDDVGVESAQETVAYIRRPFSAELKMPGAPPSIEATLRQLFNDGDWSPFIEELDKLYDQYKVSMTVVAREWPSRNPSDSDWFWPVQSQSPSTTSLDSVTGSSDFSQRDVSDDAVSSGPPSTSSSENTEAQPVRVRRSYSTNLELPETAPIRAATVRALFTQAYRTMQGDWPWFIKYLDRTFQSYKIIATVVGRDKSVSPPCDLAVGDLIALVLGALDDSAHIHSRTFAKMASATVLVRGHSLASESPAAPILPVNTSTSDGSVFSDVFNYLASRDFFEHMEGVLDYLGVFQLLGLPPVNSGHTPPQAHHEDDAAPIETRNGGGRGMPSRVPQHFEPNERVARFAAGIFPHDVTTSREFQDLVHEAVASLEIGSGLIAFRNILAEFDGHDHTAAATLHALHEKYPRRA